MPYPLAAGAAERRVRRHACDSGDYREHLRSLRRRSGWNEKAALDGKLIDGRYHGLGIACFIEGGALRPARERPHRGRAATAPSSVYVGSSAIGQGIETIMAQIAADALELPIERVRVMHGSTTYLREGFGSYGSRSTVMGGSRDRGRGERLARRISARRPRERLGVAPMQITIADGRRHARRTVARLSLAEVAAEAGARRRRHFANSKATYTYGTAIAHVAVDPGPAQVDVLDYVVVDDVGRIINPLTLHGQVIGAAVQGLGSVFSEEMATTRTASCWSARSPTT